MTSIYEMNDCLLHVSDLETFGRVIVEAGHFGLPVVVPQGPGSSELVINGHTGFTFRTCDLADCLRALECAYHWSGPEFVRIGATAQVRALALFSPNCLAEEYIGLANSIIVSSSSRP